MTFIARFVSAAFIGVAVAVLSPAAYAQEVTASHLAAALDVVKAVNTLRGYDNALPSLAAQVEDKLIRFRPDLNKQITAAVQDTAIKLAGRRDDLYMDVARIWAKAFTEDELNIIAAFYKTPAGVKFANLVPQVVQDSYQAADQWQGRVGDELLQKTRDELKAQGVDL